MRRVIEKLKAGSQIDELLIVTFTEAAAREMKERIQVALQMAINQESQEQKTTFRSAVAIITYRKYFNTTCLLFNGHSAFLLFDRFGSWISDADR